MLRNTRQSGQALVAATLGLVALLGATGLAIDMGFLRYQKRLQQSAADSAALAGAAEIASGNFTTAAQQDSSLNGFTDGANNVTVTVNNPPTSGPNQTNGHVEVLVSDVQPTFFMKIFGVNSATVTARAVAQFSGKGPRNCIYALGGLLDNDEALNVPNCGIIANGDLGNGSDNITAASVGVVGSAPTSRIYPSAVQGIVAAADPLSNLPAPPVGACSVDGTVKGSKPGNPPVMKTLDPNAGVYCNITVTGRADVTLKPGTFVVTGDISFGGQGSVTGSGVTFYVSGAGGAVTLGNNVQFDLTAPTNDPSYTGILFFQDSGNTSAATIDAAGGSKLQGAFYFPSASLTVNGGASNAAYMIFVARSLEFNTDVSFPSDYSSLTGGSPIKNAVLVE